MGEASLIEWTDHTFNPWVGCTRISPACDHCYAETWAKRTGQAHLWQGERRRTSWANWLLPIKWNIKAMGAGRRIRVFSASLADVFDNQVPTRWRDDLWHLIAQTPHLDWQLLTKRPQNIAGMLPDPRTGTPAWGDGWPNVWLGTTVESQEQADRRIPHLLNTPAAVRFVSYEPALGPIDWTRICLVPKKPGSPRAGIHLDALRGRYVESGRPYLGDWDVNGPPPAPGTPARRLHLIITGGESGPGARPAHPDWFRQSRDQCAAAGTAFFFKQWGEYLPVGQSLPGCGKVHGATAVKPGRMKLHYGGTPEQAPKHAFAERGVEFVSTADNRLIFRVGKKRAGRLLDGVEHNGMPKVPR